MPLPLVPSTTARQTTVVGVIVGCGVVEVAVAVGGEEGWAAEDYLTIRAPCGSD